MSAEPTPRTVETNQTRTAQFFTVVGLNFEGIQCYFEHDVPDHNSVYLIFNHIVEYFSLVVQKLCWFKAG